MDLLSCWRNYWKVVVLLATPIIFLPVALVGVEGRCGYVIIIMAVFWMSEVVPIPITSLIPIFAFPLLGVVSTAELTLVYMKETNMMFLGGLTVAIAVEFCNLHKRIALFIILSIGQSPRRLMTGFMITTMFLSMWISNTASTAMMVPVVDAVLQELYKTRSRKSATPEEDPRIAPHHQSKDRIAGSVEDVSMNEFPRDSENSHPDAKQIPQDEIEVDETSETVLFAPPPNEECRQIRDMMYLATAYSANLGGTGSLTGTGPNLVMKSVMEDFFPESNDINFATWMAYNVPGMLICGIFAWIWLQILFIGFSKNSGLKSDKETDSRVREVLLRKQSTLGPKTFHEKAVLVMFISLVLLWFFRSPGFMTGWGDLFYNLTGKKVADATPVMLIVFLLFIIPQDPFRKNSDSSENQSIFSKTCLTWEVVNSKVPWGIVLLLGGGFAMAKAAEKSQMSVLLGQQLKTLNVLPKEAILFIVTLMTAMVTEAASNTATASILLPVLKELSLGIGINPIYLMFPTVICCSYAFMLPVATPPNAIALGASQMSTMTMVKAGLIMNVICVCVSMMMINTLGDAMFNLQEFPAWANSSVVSTTADGLSALH